MAARLLRRWGKPEFVSLLVSGALTLAIGSCGHDEQTPVTGPVAPSPSPAPIAPLTVTRVDLIVPPSIAPGQSLQFQANARMSDGSVQDVTSLAQWSAAGRLIEIGSGGLAKGVSVGETFVTARYQSRSGSTTVLVLPAGTFRLKGTVVDEGQPLSGATVNIIGGTGEGLTTSTVSDGAYVLYGVGGHVRAQVKRDGYLNLLKDFDVTANRPDCMSVIGIAREIATAYRLPMNEPNGSLPQANRAVEITIEAPDLCGRYVGAVADVTVAPSPQPAKAQRAILAPAVVSSPCCCWVWRSSKR